MKRNFRKRLAGILAASMAVAVLAPARPVYAASAEVIFDTGYGPTLKESKGELWKAQGVVSDSVEDPETGYRKETLAGVSGYLYQLDARFNSYLGNTDVMSNYGTPYERPIMPDWDVTSLTNREWDGYTFKGWYTDRLGGERVTKLSPSFPYSDEVLYARWEGDSSKTFDFKVVHERTTSDRNGQEVKFNFLAADQDGIGTTQPKVVETAVSASRKNIPGYTFDAVWHSPERSKRYGDTAAGTNKGFKVELPSSTGPVFFGTMPNDDLTVNYTYKVDTSKEFPLTVRYVDENNNPIPGVPELKKRFPAETNLNIQPSNNIDSNVYIVESKEVTQGLSGDLVSRGTFGVSDIGYEWNGNEFIGKMPNQALTITYKYKLNPDFQPIVRVNYINSSQDNLHTEGILDESLYPNIYYLTPVNPQPSMEIPVPDLTSFGYSASFNVKDITALTSVVVHSDKIEVTPDFRGGSVTIEYVEDFNNPNLYSQLSFRQGANGTVQGDTSPRILRNGDYAIDRYGNIETLESMVVDPDDGYLFDGWYEVDASGNKIDNNPIERLELNENKTIKAFFVEDPESWFDITFQEGNHVTFASQTRTFHVMEGTCWNDIVPVLLFDNGYELDYWFNSSGVNVNISANPPFIQSDTFTVKAKSIDAIPGEDLLNRPDIEAKFGTDGSGEIKVNSPNTSRKYAVTDVNGEIIEVLQGQNVNFTGLTPGSEYRVYEIHGNVIVQAGTNINAIIAQDRSQPAEARIPAINDNYRVEPDQNNPGSAVIIIEPAAPNTEYALLDEDGAVVEDWKLPSGVPLKVEFTDLEPDKTYRVVTRPVGSTVTPGDQRSDGSNVDTSLEPAPSYTTYKIQVVDGTIISAGNTSVNDSVYEQAEPGSRIKIKADDHLPDQVFTGWSVLGGEIPAIESESREEVYFIMPEYNVTIKASYRSVATPSDLKVTYEVDSNHLGEVGLNIESGTLENLAEDFRTSDDDMILSTGKNINYKIKFNKRAARLREENALKIQSAFETAFKTAWALDINTFRYVNNELVMGSQNNQVEFEVFAQMDADSLNYFDYQLWKVHEDSQGIHATEISMDPDLNQDSENGRFITFIAESEFTYVLTYSESKLTKIKDTKTNDIQEINVRKGDVLSGWNPPADYTDANGLVWTYKGLSTNELVYQGYEFDLSTAILQDTVLYIHYESSDPAWENARNELENKIREAEDLIDGGTLTPQKKNDLQTAIDHARDLLNRNPIPSTNELIQEKNDLQKAIDKARATEPGPGPGPGPSPGGNGGGGSTTTNTKKYLTAGVDGDWKLIDPANHQWIFELRSGSRVTGKWAEISYTHNGTARTHWYHFNSDGIMDSGWFLDGGTWYYLSTTHDGWFGNMLTGWQYSSQEGKWYYLDPASGAMAVGWREINGKWYYFTESNQRNTYSYDPLKKQWVYLNVSERPLGSMYAGERTPDGYQVNADGAWTDVK